MELVYLYLHDYRRFKEQNINFGSEYIFKYDNAKSELIVENNNLYIDRFYNSKNSKNILNISSIIGENGTGKTGLLDYIIKIYSDGAKFGSNEPFLFIVKKNKVFYLYYSSDIFTIKNLSDLEKKLTIKSYALKTEKNQEDGISINFGYDYLNLSNDEFKVRVLKISNIFFGYGYSGISNVFDQSNDGLISEYKIGKDFVEFEKTDFYLQLNIENNRNYVQLFKFLHDKNLNSLIPFKIPHFVLLRSFNDYGSNFSLIKNEDVKDSYKIFSDILDLFYNKLNIYQDYNLLDKSFSKFSFIVNILSFVPIDFFNVIINMLDKNSENYQKHIDNTITYFENANKPFQDLLGMLKDKDSVKKIFEAEGEILNLKLGQLIDNFKNHINKCVSILGDAKTHFGASLISTLDFINKILESNTKDFEGQFFDFKKSSLYFDFDYFITSNIMGFYNKAYNIRPYIEFDFDVPLSSGQYAFLNIFSRVLKVVETFKKESNKEKIIDNKILLVIDEIELYLHPNWQKSIVNTLIEFLNVLFPKYEFQIIFTANNPIPASDLFSYNTIFLESNEFGNKTTVKDSLEDQQETFAANIHTLLADSFFVKGGLIGEFAKSKINEIIKLFINGNELSKEEHRQIKLIIKQIGEPVIKNKLMQIYSQNNGLDFLERLERVEDKLGLK